MKVRVAYPFVLGIALCAAASAQDSNTSPAPAPGQAQGQRGGGRGGWGGGMGMGRGLMGTVTEVGADHYTIKTESGETYTVRYSANTRILKQPVRARGIVVPVAAAAGAAEAEAILPRRSNPQTSKSAMPLPPWAKWTQPPSHWAQPW
jgi:hypothetical protein